MNAEPLIRLSDPRPAGYRDIAPAAAQPHLAGLHVVDVREPDEFVGPLGHLPRAELVPLATVVTTSAGWDRDRPLLVVCRSGGRSGRAAAALAQVGFRAVFNLAGGMLAWDAGRLPVERT